MASDLKLQLRLEMQTAQGESALKRFDAALDAALKKMGAGGREVGLIKQLAAEVEASKKKLSELPPHYRKLVEQINQANRGAKLLDEVGITRTHAQIRAEIERVRQSFAALKQSGMLTYPELAQAAERTRAAIRGLGEQMIGARTQGERMLESISRIGTVMNLMAGALAGNQIVRVADDMQRLIGRLAVVEGSAAGARARLADLAAIASRSGADVEATASGYAKMATSIRNAGGSTQQALDMTEALALALKVSGADATQTSATMMQLAQALQKGVLNGDEFTSVAENGGKVLDYLAFALGKTRGQLRQMAADGALTTAELLKLTTQLDRIRKDAENIPATVGDAFQRLTNSAKLWVADSERVGVATRALIAVIDFAAEHFGKLVDLLMLAGVGVIVARIGSIVAAMRVLAASLGIIAGLSPVGRVVMGLVTAFTLLVDPVQRAWQALTSRGADASARLGEVGNALESIKTIATQAGDAIRQALDAETKKAAETVKQLSASYKQVADDIKAIWDARVAEIESNYQREVAAAQNAAHSESAAIRESVQSLLAAEREKLAAVEAGARQMESAWKATYGQAVALARAAGQDVQAIERQAVEARIAIYSQLESAYRATVDRLIAEEQRHLQAAKAADEARLNLRLSVEDRIRELTRKGMDEYAAYQDRLRQIDEKQAQARAALAAGNYDQARKLAEEAIALAERTASAVTRQVEQNGKTVTQTVVSEGQAAATAIGEIKEAAAIADAALKGLGDAHKQAASAAGQGADEAKRALASVSDELDKLRQALLSQDKLKLEVDIEAAKAGIEKLKALTEAQQLVAKIQADTSAAQASLEKLKSDTDNLQLLAKVEADTTQVMADIDRLKGLLSSANVEIPAMVSFDQPRQQLASFALDARTVLSAPTSATHTVQPDLRQYRAAVSELLRPTSSTHTIYVSKVYTNAAGGLIERFAAGGQAIAQGFRRMSGRIVGPGTETSDSIPALLSHGEFVIRAASVRKFGEAFFAALNAGFLPPMPRYALGGAVGAMIPSSAEQPARDVVDLRFHIGGRTHTVQSSRETAMQLAQALRELSRGA